MENLNNQGRNRKKYETSARTAFYGWCGVVGMVILLAIFTLLSSCSTTKKVDECCSSKNIVE